LSTYTTLCCNRHLDLRPRSILLSSYCLRFAYDNIVPAFASGLLAFAALSDCHFANLAPAPLHLHHAAYLQHFDLEQPQLYRRLFRARVSQVLHGCTVHWKHNYKTNNANTTFPLPLIVLLWDTHHLGGEIWLSSIDMRSCASYTAKAHQKRRIRAHTNSNRVNQHV
jgi:hypothetical protein